MDRYGYNPMLMMKWNLEPNTMVIANLGNWDETEDKLIETAQEINKKMRGSLKLGLMNMVSYKEFIQAPLSQEAITLDADANDADYYLNYVFDMPKEFDKQEEVFTSMKNNLNVNDVVIRDDFMIGDQKVELDTLNKVFGDEHVHVIKSIKEQYSIDALKDMLSKGDMQGYREETGISWSYKGPVVKGKGLGHTYGYPTANQTPKFELPIKHGVYYTQVKIPNEDETHPAMTCYWKNEQGIDTIETYILDFDKDIYGNVIEVFFEQWIRDLKPMKTKEEIVNALEDDEQHIRDYFIGDESIDA